MSGTDWRALCEELVEALDGWHQAVFETGVGWVRPDETYLLARARAALAQPEPEVVGPTDVELMDLHDWMTDEWAANHDFELPPSQYARAVLAHWGNYPAKPDSSIDGPAVPESREPVAVVGEPSDEELLELAQYHSISYTMSDGTVVYPLQEGCDMRDDVLSFARAVLAYWGRPAPAPAVDCPACEGTPRPGNQPRAVCGRSAPVVDGAEVADLVWWLRSLEDASVWFETGSTEARRLARAADLLERQAAPVPVAVSERLPQPEDCNAEGRCWWWYPPVPEQTYGYWLFEDDATDRAYDEWPSAWLPAHALPLPTTEPQP